MSDLQPICARCRARHVIGLRCWRGRYAQRLSRYVLQMQGRVCWMCGGEASAADHVIPRSRGGGDSPGNLRPACMACNSRRGNTANPFEAEPEARPTGVGLSSRWRPK